MTAALLKLSTLEAHQRVETVFSPIIMRRGLHPAAYVKVLASLYRLHYRIEGAVSQYPEFLRLIEARSKLDWLLADIQAVDGSLTQSEILEGLAVSPKPFALDSVAACWGAMYVVEGSTLGGALISRHLQQLSWVRPERHLHYFANYGDQRGARWKEFTAMLNEYSEQHEQQIDQMTASANRVFSWFEREFSAIENG